MNKILNANLPQFKIEIIPENKRELNTHIGNLFLSSFFNRLIKLDQSDHEALSKIKLLSNLTYQKVFDYLNNNLGLFETQIKTIGFEYKKFKTLFIEIFEKIKIIVAAHNTTLSEASFHHIGSNNLEGYTGFQIVNSNTQGVNSNTQGNNSTIPVQQPNCVRGKNGRCIVSGGSKKKSKKSKKSKKLKKVKKSKKIIM